MIEDDFNFLMAEANIYWPARRVSISHYDKLRSKMLTMSRSRPVWFLMPAEKNEDYKIAFAIAAKIALMFDPHVSCLAASEAADFASKDWHGFLQTYRNHSLFMDGITADYFTDREWIGLAKIRRKWRYDHVAFWLQAEELVKDFLANIPDRPDILFQFKNELRKFAQVIEAREYVRGVTSSRQDS